MTVTAGRCRPFATLLVALCWLAALAAGVRALEYCPGGIVRIVVPFPAGGPVDSAARILSGPMQSALGRTVIIENRSGASGAVGTAYTTQQPGDGCTVLMAYDTHGVNPVLIPNLSFDTLKDLRSVMLIGTVPNVYAVRAASPWKTIADVVEAARRTPDQITYGTGGNGTLSHLATKLVESGYRIKLRHVPFRGGGPVAQAILGGHIDLAVGSALVLGPLIADGSVRALAQTGTDRHPNLPDVPTLNEAGLPGFSAVSWIGVFLPAAASDEIAGTLFHALNGAMRQPDVKARLSALAIEVSGTGRTDLDALVRSEIARWGKVVADNGIRPD